MAAWGQARRRPRTAATQQALKTTKRRRNQRLCTPRGNRSAGLVEGRERGGATRRQVAGNQPVPGKARRGVTGAATGFREIRE